MSAFIDLLNNNQGVLALISSVITLTGFLLLITTLKSDKEGRTKKSAR